MSASARGPRRTAACALPAAVFLAAALVTVPSGPARAGAPGGEPACAPPWEIRYSDRSPAQGEPILVEFTRWAGADNVAVAWKGRRFPLKPAGEDRFLGIVGVDLLDPPGNVPLVLFVSADGAACRIDDGLEVRARRFRVQRLSLPPQMAEFDPPTVARIRDEAARLNERMSAAAGPPAWELPLSPPVEDFRPANFGSRRIINGEPRSPHAGVDIGLPEGTPVTSIADGAVIFVGEQYLGGNSVVIDHGGGLLSIYYHLEEYSVAEGQRVSRGEPIGAVGKSGRAVGPHLHFGVRAAGGRVDPALLFRLDAEAHAAGAH